jgi:hypothetical protein
MAIKVEIKVSRVVGMNDQGYDIEQGVFKSDLRLDSVSLNIVRSVAAHTVNTLMLEEFRASAPAPVLVYDVRLLVVGQVDEPEVVACLVKATPMELGDAQIAAANTPAIVISGVGKEKAEHIVSLLREHGAGAEIVERLV